jgi:hypothetical protein
MYGNKIECEVDHFLFQINRKICLKADGSPCDSISVLNVKYGKCLCSHVPKERWGKIVIYYS